MSDSKPYTLKEFDKIASGPALFSDFDAVYPHVLDRLRATVEQRDALIRLLTRTLDNCKFWSDDFKDEVRDALEGYDQDN